MGTLVVGPSALVGLMGADTIVHCSVIMYVLPGCRSYYIGVSLRSIYSCVI